MKNSFTFALTLVVIATTLLVSCSGVPKAPVSTQFDLEKLVEDNITIDQINNMMTTDLKSSYTLYQAEKITYTSGSWSVYVPQGGIAAGTPGDYQVIFFKPYKGRTEYYAIFFKANECIGDAWFSGSYGVLMEKVLKGEKVTTGTN